MLYSVKKCRNLIHRNLNLIQNCGGEMSDRENREHYDYLVTNVYRDSTFFKKLIEIFNKRASINGKKKNIADRMKDLLILDLNDKFQKHYLPFLDCLLRVKFNHKDSFRFYIVIRRDCLRKGRPYMRCRKMYLINQLYFDRVTLNRVIKELEEKNMLKIKKEDGFVFTPVLDPLSWILSEEEREEIKKEVERDIKRLDEKWIPEKKE